MVKHIRLVTDTLIANRIHVILPRDIVYVSQKNQLV
jgi:hypothetical protein